MSPARARLGGFAALALLGALQWQRMVLDSSSARALLWVLVAVAAGAAVLWADGRRRWGGVLTIAVAPISLLAAYVSSGLELGLLKPRRLDELTAGLSHGAETLASVEMPYAGSDPWPAATLQLLGAVICVLAGLLAFWPRASETGGARGYPFLSLALLLVLVAAPVVSIGGTQPVALGIVLTALTVCFLWLERLPLKPGIGIAAMLALALAGALPLASAADGDQPWFDYQSFAERFGPDEPLTFDWGHDYGPIDWPRDGAEVLRITTTRPSYWKMHNLSDFDGAKWVDSGVRLGGFDSRLDLARGWQVQAQWRQTLRVTLRRLQTREILGTGTTLSVSDAAGGAVPAEPGVWQSREDMAGGDSYTVKAFAPRPSPAQLAESDSGADARRAADLNITVPVEGDSSGVPGAPSIPVEIRFPPFAPRGAGVPYAIFPTLVRSHDGDRALRHSAYRRTWRLAQQLSSQAKTPYDYVIAVNRYLQDGFSYDERPAAVTPGAAALDDFLFDTKRGYCQHFSGAMALLLRMGGVPARVVTGFSPGGYSKSRQAWIVRDTDAHSWVEVWFDRWGWVTFDPTPPDTPARSQIAALDQPDAGASDRGDAASGDGSSPAAPTGLRPDLLGTQSGPGGAASAAAAGDGGPPWWWFALAVPPLLALVAWFVARRRRRSLGPAVALDRAVAELQRALRRVGRPAAASLTLRQLEQRLARTPEAAAYVHALRSARYAPAPAPPPPGGRRALRRELARGHGPGAWLRALWALPPWRA